MNSMTLNSTTAGSSGVASHRSPSLGALGIVYTALFLASIVLVKIWTQGAQFPRPDDPVAIAQAFYLKYAVAIRISSFLQFGAAIPLGLFTATVTSRLRFLGITAAGVSIALFGGIAASIFLAISALGGWILAQPGVANYADVTRVMELFAFVTGGPGHVVPFGLLLAGVSVPGLILRLLPRWLAWLGFILAVIAELSSLSLVFPALYALLPIARFVGFVWLVGAGFTLPRAKGEEA